MMNSSEARSLLLQCGEDIPLTDDKLKSRKYYVICYVYSDTQSASLDQSRVLKWNGQKKKSLMRLPPAIDRLNLHIMHAN